MSASVAASAARNGKLAALMPWVIGIVTAIDYFDNALFAFFASYIAGGVSASADELVWASSAYALGAVLGILNQHAWIERLGYRRYLAICMFAFAVGGVCAALSDNSVQLMLARGFQGYFVGPMLGACRTLIQVGIPPQRRAKALKSFMVLVVFSGALAPVVGAYLVTHFEWRSLFFCTAPIALLTGAMALWTLPDLGDVAP
jgi:MFS family permease